MEDWAFERANSLWRAQKKKKKKNIWDVVLGCRFYAGGCIDYLLEMSVPCLW